MNQFIGNLRGLFLLLFILILIIGCNNDTPKVEKKEVPTAEVAPAPLAMSKTEEINHSFSIDYLMGKFDPAKHVDFIEIPIKYADRKGLFLRKDVFDGFLKMHEAAAKDGLKFQIRSATRNFKNQKRIWESKWTGTRKIENGKDASKTYPNPIERALKILEYSSMPGTSRHHWGTDIDLNNFTNEYFESGKGLKEYEWLMLNASKFGFCQVYSPKGAARSEGYNEEKWHWSFLPVAQKLTKLAKDKLKDEQISGFAGAETATEIGVVQKYVLGISPDCFD